MKRRLLLAAIFAVLAAGYAAARDPLNIAEREAAAAAKRAEHFRQRAATATSEATRARAGAETLVAEIQKIEAEITAAEARLARIERQRTQQRIRLAEKQQPLIRITAALQTMAARPPALALAQPGSVDDLVRVRALLASTMPAVRVRTAALEAELAEADRLKGQAGAALAELNASRRQLADRRVELARFEQGQLHRSEQLQSAFLQEAERSIAFSEEARELMASMSSRQQQARMAADLAGLAGPVLRPQTERVARRPPPYRLPVAAEVVTGMGELSDAGVHMRGVTFRTSKGLPVTAPRAGRVAYSGRFRSYGEIVIIDHGGGWTSTITGLAALRVRQGDRVQAGELLGRASGQISVELRQNGEPRPLTAYLV